MKKIDRRINYKVVLDCETCPVDTTSNGVNPWNMWVYDLGWAIVDKRGKVYKTQSFINAEIFFNEKELMDSSYYAEKIPMYLADIRQGTRKVASWYHIRKALMEDIEEYSVTEVFAHNMRFDYGAITNTQRWLTKSKYRYFFTKDLEICDTLKMARQVIGKMPTYKSFCKKNGFMTKRNQVSMTAENLYKFISRNMDFEESHTGLEDVLIEKDIMAYCYKQHKKMEKRLWAR